MKLQLAPQLTAKNTLEASRIIAEAFVSHFGNEWGTEKDIIKLLIPKGKASSWAALDRHLSHFAKQFYDSYPSSQESNPAHEEIINFIDTIRFSLKDLPQRLDYKLPDHKKEYTSPQEVAEHFTTCSLCWRSVLRRPLEKKKPLCYLHDISCHSQEYRKRYYLKQYLETTKLQIIKSLPHLIHVKLELGAELNAYILSLCTPKTTAEKPTNQPTSETAALPYLANYLASLGMPLFTPKALLHALEVPIYQNKLSPITRQAWEWYFEDRSKNLRLSYIQLITAEAWLKLEAEKKHGGVRTKRAEKGSKNN
ncbi:hypothetical protein LJC46_01745 [Desulfovibrio sp. OttesenSCG-928-G15]|nr:hypothetical protein [Desulfovibrio sp. OttesenSCG-928-G15]